MPMIKKLKQKFDEKVETAETPKLSHILSTLLDVVGDGSINTEDYDKLVEAVKELAAIAIPAIDIPRVPESLEKVAFDSWAVPLAQNYADELVDAVFEYFHIPKPEVS